MLLLELVDKVIFAELCQLIEVLGSERLHEFLKMVVEEVFEEHSVHILLFEVLSDVLTLRDQWQWHGAFEINRYCIIAHILDLG